MVAWTVFPQVDTPYGQAPMGLEGSGASRRPGSIVRVLRTERLVQPTERAGSEGSFICRLRRAGFRRLWRGRDRDRAVLSSIPEG